MTERQKVTKSKLLAAVETEFAQLLGRSVTEYMLIVRLHARAGEPNWNAELDRAVGISVLGPFLVAVEQLRASYNLGDDDSAENRPAQPRPSA